MFSRKVHFGLAKLLDEDLPCAFVLADAVYGSDARFRRMLEARGQAYVLAVRSNHTLRIFEDWQLTQTDPETMIAGLPQDEPPRGYFDNIRTSTLDRAPPPEANPHHERHLGLVTMATRTSNHRRRGTSKTTQQCATVVLSRSRRES